MPHAPPPKSNPDDSAARIAAARILLQHALDMEEISKRGRISEMVRQRATNEQHDAPMDSHPKVAPQK